MKSILDLFRSYGLFVTVGVTTGNLDHSTWNEIQKQLDKGNVEIASHSRTHTFNPYSNAGSETEGSYEDIVSNLKLPEKFTMNDRQLVYIWIAPSGDYDEVVDSFLTLSNYLVPRLYLNLPVKTPRDFVYGDSNFSSWNYASKIISSLFIRLLNLVPLIGAVETLV